MIIYAHPKIIEIPRGGEFKVIAFGDVHWGAASCNTKRFEDRVLRENADNPDAYFLGMGDMLDGIGPNDPRFRPGEGDGREDFIDEQVDSFVNLFKKHGVEGDRILGLGHGNHEDTLKKYSGTHPTKRICNALGTKNLGLCFMLRVKTLVRGTTKLPISFFGHHGFAGGRKEGSSVNTYIDHAFRHPGHNVYLYGHNHKKWSTKVPTTEANWKSMTQKDRTMVVGNTGTYMMTYSKGETPTYAEKRGFYPVELGHLELVFKHRRETKKGKGKEWLDVSVIE